MCEILIDKDKFYKIYIHLLTRQSLISIIERFRDLINIEQIVGVINGTHVPLWFQPSMKNLIAPWDFNNHKRSFSVVVQRVCDTNKNFGIYL